MTDWMTMTDEEIEAEIVSFRNRCICVAAVLLGLVIVILIVAWRMQ